MVLLSVLISAGIDLIFLILKTSYFNTKLYEDAAVSKQEKNLRRGKIHPLYNYDPDF